MEKRIEKRTYTVDKTIYICSDGREFENEKLAQQYEDSIIPFRKVEEYYLTLDTLDEYGSYCYKINEEEDLKYLQAKEWNHHGYGEYEGPGWYVTIRHDGGDYNDSYDFIKIDNYKIMLENDLDTIKHLTSS